MAAIGKFGWNVAAMTLLAAVVALATALLSAATPAFAASAPSGAQFERFSNPNAPVLAVQTTFAAVGGAVRLAIYDSEDDFLESAARKVEARIDSSGLALFPLAGLPAGAYAFAVYLDQNEDGELNRGGLLGRPKEPYAFSNGVKAKLSRPTFKRTKVSARAGDVIVVTLDD